MPFKIKNDSFRRIILLIIFFSSLSLHSEEPIGLFLTWEQDPTTSMVIRWVSSTKEIGDKIDYQALGDFYWQSTEGYHTEMPDNYPYYIHHVELTHLQPHQVYQFRIGKEKKVYRFQTLPSSVDQPIRFVVGGDMYNGSLETFHQTNVQVAKLSPQFILIGGDIAYSGSKFRLFKEDGKRWLEWLSACKTDLVTSEGNIIPIIPAIGNHEVNGRFEQTPQEALFFYALFPMPGPQGYNVLDFGNYMSLFILDSGHTHPISGTQSEWLYHSLKLRKNRPHKFAIYHVPAYPSTGDFKSKYSLAIRQNWVPIFDNFNLDAAFEHHAHTYKRSKLLSGNKVTSKGVLYLGDGAWGVKKARIPKVAKKSWFLAKTASKRHFILVTLTEESRLFQAIDSKGHLFDEAWVSVQSSHFDKPKGSCN